MGRGGGGRFSKKWKIWGHFSEVTKTGTENYHGSIMVCILDPMPTPWIASIFCLCHIAPLAPCYVKKLMKSKCGSMAKQTNKQNKTLLSNLKSQKGSAAELQFLGLLKRLRQGSVSKGQCRAGQSNGRMEQAEHCSGQWEKGSWGDMEACLPWGISRCLISRFSLESEKPFQYLGRGQGPLL